MVKFGQRLAIALVEVAFDALYDSLMDDFILKEISLLALLLDHSLEKYEDMSLLSPCQLHNCLSERILILLSQRLAVLDRKMRVDVLIK